MYFRLPPLWCGLAVLPVHRCIDFLRCIYTYRILFHPILFRFLYHIAQKEDVKPGLYPVLMPVVSGVRVLDTQWCQMMLDDKTTGYAVYGGEVEFGARLLEPSVLAREYGCPLGSSSEEIEKLKTDNLTLSNENKALKAENELAEETLASHIEELNTATSNLSHIKEHHTSMGEYL